MFFTADQIRNLSESELVKFLNRRVPESTGVIDYKLELSGGKGKDRETTELLKDVSAFANAEGGHLLIGMNEPASDTAGETALVGIDAGDQVATQIEQQCAACIDPRIPGLLVRSIALENGKSAVIVHVPPSPSRPHMVAYEPTKVRTFYIRHSETAQPMKSSEVRQAVLSAAAGNQNAIDYAAEQERRFSEQYSRGKCAIYVHAIPLVAVEVLWNVTDDPWRIVIDGNHRRNKREHINLFANRRRPSVEGIIGFEDEENPKYVYEVHRTGYMGGTLIVSALDMVPNPQPSPHFWDTHCEFFSSFADICEECLQLAGSDRPYLMQASVSNALTAVLEYRGGFASYLSKPLKRNELRFPNLRRDSGQSFEEAVKPWTPIFYNAFGVDYKSR